MTTGTNLKLTYDEANDSWSYQNVDYEYPSSGTPSWSGYTSPDPDFEFAPPPPDENEQDNDTVCPPGYIYDETLKQCLPDPNYRAPAYAGEPGGDDDDRQDPVFKSFDASTPEGRQDMFEHGQKQKYFTTDTSKGGAYEFLGPPKAPNLGVFTPAAQFGKDRQYNRYINELNREDLKRQYETDPITGELLRDENNNLIYRKVQQPRVLAQAVGFFGLNKNFQNWGKKTMEIHSPNTGFQFPVKDMGAMPGGASDRDIDSLERALRAEKLKQEIEKTKQQKIKTSSTIKDSQITETSPDGVGGRDESGDTYTQINRDRSKGSTGYTFTPKVSKPSVSQKTKGGVSYGTGRGGTKEKQQQMKKQDTGSRKKPRTGPDLTDFR